MMFLIENTLLAFKYKIFFPHSLNIFKHKQNHITSTWQLLFSFYKMTLLTSFTFEKESAT